MTGTDDHRLRLIPLGGLGEFGLNALVVEWGDARLLIDAGVMFPTTEMPGVDSIVPDFQPVAAAGGALAVLLTHGHEDHIGALAFALQATPAPVYGSPLALGFARRRLSERGVQADLRPMKPGEPVEIGPFRVHPIRVAHSVVDSLALAIETPAGVVLASGDFKMSGTGAEEEKTDAEALAAWGRRGVLVLLSDSTNVEVRGRTGAEDDVIPAFEEVFARTPGRVLVSCFATSIPRIQRVADLGRRHGRSLAFVGRRMADNTEVALDLGLLRIPASELLSAAEVCRLPPERQLLFVSGSQGEPLSALSMVSVDEHREVSVGPGDTVVLSARAIPGNERTVSRLISNLFRRGAEVVHPGTARVHVSGHGSRDDLVALLDLVRPRHLVPVHGEYRMLAQHARLAVEAGIPEDRVFVLEDGDVLAFGPEGARREARVAAPRVLLDRTGTDGLGELVIRDRRQLAADGVVVPIIVLDKQTGRLQAPPEIVSRGFVSEALGEELLEEASRVVATTVSSRPAAERDDPALTRERVRAELRRFFRKRTNRRPMILPVLMEV